MHSWARAESQSMFTVWGCKNKRSSATLLASLQDAAHHRSTCGAAAWSRSRARHVVAPWTAAHQSPLSMGFSNQEY